MQTSNKDVNELFFIKQDIDSLVNLCQVNKTAFKFCSSTEFWKRKFEYDNLRLPKRLPSTLREWIKLYDNEYLDAQYTYDVRYKVYQLLRILQDPLPTDFQTPVHNDELGPLFVTGFNWLELVDLYDINFDDVKEIWYGILSKMVSDEQIMLDYYVNGKYNIHFLYYVIENPHNSRKLCGFSISELSMKKLLYKVLTTGGEITSANKGALIKYKDYNERNFQVFNNTNYIYDLPKNARNNIIDYFRYF